MPPKRRLCSFQRGLKLPSQETRQQKAHRLAKQEERRAALTRLRALATHQAVSGSHYAPEFDDAQAWEDIDPPDQGEPGSYWAQVGTLNEKDTETLRQIHTFNEGRLQRQRHRNWASLLDTLFPAYLHLKNVTNNWSAQNSFDDHSASFCTCDPEQKSTRTIDAVDILGNKPLAISSCACTPDAVHILAHGYLASTPVIPTTCFSMRLLNFHHLLWNLCNVHTTPFAEVLTRWNGTLSDPILTRTRQPRNLRRPLSCCIDAYRRLLTKREGVVDNLTNLSPQEVLARRSCPACFGPMPQNGLDDEPTDNRRIIICLDGNFQHRHHAKATKNHIPLFEPSTFIPQKAVEDADRAIQAAEQQISKTDKARDRCSDMHKAADDKRNASTWKGCDDTGLLGSCCRHDALVYMCNIHKSGERRCLSLATLQRIMSELDPQSNVGILYDIGCSLEKFVHSRNLLSTWQHRMCYGTSVFHSYVHDWPCQLKYNPRYNETWGLSDGEGLERLWSYLSPLVSPLRYATRNHRLSALHHRINFHNEQGISKLPDVLNRKFITAIARRQSSHRIIRELSNTPNPFSEGGQNFTEAFFRDQWAAQHAFERTQTTETIERKTQLAQLYEREERMTMLKDKLIHTDLSSCDLALDILDEISALQAEQAEQMEDLGSLTSSLNTADREQEHQLVLLWSAKSTLFKIAVDLHGERQPLLHSKDRGERLGTRLKEKIFEALKRRKPMVVKALTVFCKRRKEYFAKFSPDLLASQGQELTYKEFMEMGLTHEFWNDGFCYVSKEPWAVDSSVRAGIQATLLLDRSREEVFQLSSELRRFMSWGVTHHNKLTQCIQSCQDGNQNDILLPELEFPGFDLLQKRALLAQELISCLQLHENLLVGWSEKVGWMWRKTCTPTEAAHPWFTMLDQIQSAPQEHNQQGEMDQALEEMVLEQEDADGEGVTDDLVAELVDNLGEVELPDRLLDDWEEE